MPSRQITIAICFVIAIGLGLGLVWPKYQSLTDLQATIQEKDIELHSKTEYFSQVRGVSEKLLEYEEELSKISDALPSESSLPALFYFLQLTTAQTGLILKDVSQSGGGASETKNGDVGGINTKGVYVNLSLSGSYSALKNFLLALEKSARLIEVRSISFFAPQELATPFSFEVSLKAHSY